MDSQSDWYLVTLSSWSMDTWCWRNLNNNRREKYLKAARSKNNWCGTVREQVSINQKEVLHCRIKSLLPSLLSKITCLMFTWSLPGAWDWGGAGSVLMCGQPLMMWDITRLATSSGVILPSRVKMWEILDMMKPSPSYAKITVLAHDIQNT